MKRVVKTTNQGKTLGSQWALLVITVVFSRRCGQLLPKSTKRIGRSTQFAVNELNKVTIPIVE